MKVSVLMVTYKHERYLAQAIDSVLMQEADFDWDLVIGEDCSPDGTRHIVENYARRHPERLRPLLRPRNIGAQRNFMDTLANCHGDYVAILDGDDYWTDPRKLQKQADALDAHPEWAICYHPAAIVDAAGQPLAHEWPPPEYRRPVATLRRLIREDFIPTCSVMFRHRLFAEFPAWMADLGHCDWPLHVLNAQHGNIGFLPETMVCYRYHGGGVWSGKPQVDQWRAKIKTMTCFARHLGWRYRGLTTIQRAYLHGELGRRLVWDRQPAQARHCFWTYLLQGGWLSPQERGAILREIWWLMLKNPGVRLARRLRYPN